MGQCFFAEQNKKKGKVYNDIGNILILANTAIKNIQNNFDILIKKYKLGH
jgi:hypothetical protein